jgi:chromosome segregation ATPase
MADQPKGVQTKTSIDSLLELLREKGKSELTNVSASLGVGTTILEQWAKVLEEAKLINVTYEMGKMYMEPLNLAPEQEQQVKTKSAAEKFTLDNQMELEKISVDKFYKSLDTLTANVNQLDQVYKQKMPQLHTMMDELDKLYAPIDQKTKKLSEVKQNSEAYLAQLDAKMDALYTKVGVLSSGNIDSMLKTKTTQLEDAMKRAEEAERSMKTVEQTKSTFYQQLSKDIDKRTDELKKQLKKSVEDIYAVAKSEGDKTGPIMKMIKEDIAQQKKVSLDAGQIKRDVEDTVRAIGAARTTFKDRYQKAVDDLNSTEKIYELKYEAVKREIDKLKEEMGSAGKIYEYINTAKGEIGAIKLMIDENRKEVDSITEALKAIEGAKALSVEKRAQAVDEIKKRAAATGAKTREIKKSLDKASKALKDQKG